MSRPGVRARRGVRGHVVCAVLSTLPLVVAGGAGLHAQIPQTEHTLRLDSAASPPTATVDDFAWLAGHWIGEGLGGVSEEMWAPPRGGQMLGMYRLVVDGEPRFFELITLLEVDGRVLMRLKHFDADLRAWEEPGEWVDFPLVRLDAERIYFAGLTYERRGADEVVVWLALGQDGVVHEEEFRMRRVAPAGR